MNNFNFVWLMQYHNALNRQQNYLAENAINKHKKIKYSVIQHRTKEYQYRNCSLQIVLSMFPVKYIP